MRFLPRIRAARPTPRNLWLLLAGLVASHNLLATHLNGHTPETLLFVVLVWMGALICVEDQLPELHPRPTRLGLVLGTVLLVATVLRSSLITYRDSVVYFAAPIEGLALALLAFPPRELRRCASSLLILLLLPVLVIMGAVVLPEPFLAGVTAAVTSLLLQTLGFAAYSDGRHVSLPQGGVFVAASCTGIGTLIQCVAVAVIFLLAFPLSRWWLRLLALLVAPVLAIAANAIRITLLAFLTLNGGAEGKLFDFFHEDMGSLIFSGLAVLLFGAFYVWLVETDLRHRPRRRLEPPG